MNLERLGEFGLIDLIEIPDYAPEQVILGRGDDCAVLPFHDNQFQIVSCDLLVEDVHFVRTRITPQQLGYKSVAVNFSDIAAMGGKPVHILLSLALPPDYTVEEWKGFYQGVDDICRKYHVNVIGGDTTSSKDKLTIQVSVLGVVEQQNLHLRSAAKPGDVIFVTGSLGGSRAGLELMLDDTLTLPQHHEKTLIQCHCTPEPCCEEIAALNRIAGADLHALNDISDGLLSECREIAQASGVALVVQPEQVPVNESCTFLAERLGEDGLHWAMTGGEDYQLVGTMAAERAEEICAQYRKETGGIISLIGIVKPGNGVYLLQDGIEHQAEQRGYDHFNSESHDTQRTPAHMEHVMQQMEQLLHMMQVQLQEVGEWEEKQRVYAHDMHNHLACLSGLLQCGEIEEARQYLAQMADAVPVRVQKQYSSRMVLNILLNQKAKLAEQNQMELQINCEDGLLDFMRDYDLCTLLGNLLDNGIEHSGYSEDAYLYLDIIQNGEGGAVIRMENSCETRPVLQNGCFITQKAEQCQHGKGMQQIRLMTEYYGGKFTWTYDAAGKRFITQCEFSMIS